MILELRNFGYERLFQQLELISLKQKRLQGHAIETYKYLKGFNDAPPDRGRDRNRMMGVGVRVGTQKVCSENLSSEIDFERVLDEENVWISCLQ
ncbi:hypothetical protein FHG87_010784 [Trinorchestia longiramus]|nr:hypothetical protein FHG87_010784 [Trinorchestia longiramus]